MLKHIVMFRFKEFAEGSDKAENMQKMKSQLEGLADQIDEIRFFEVGVNVANSNTSYDMVLCSEFDDQDALYSYQRHPAHKAVLDFVTTVCENRVVTDYIV